MASKKVEFAWRKKPTPSTNIPLLSLRKSEQKRQKMILFQEKQNWNQVPGLTSIDQKC